MTEFAYEHPGSCECGAVRFVFRAPQPLALMTARSCQCLYCQPRGSSYLSDADSALHVRVKELRYLYAHRFGTNTADFMHCVICNMQVFVRSEIEGHVYALVSAAALTGFDQLQDFNAVDYDGETLAQRLGRRSQAWIPELRIQCDDVS
jgi:hypothetical protein